MPAPFNTVHADTVVITWIGMAIVLVVVGILASVHPVTKLTKRYTFMELIVSGIGSQVETILGKNGVPFVPLIISLFMFIFVMNEIGLFPFVGTSPTADLNTTAALAIFVIVLIQIVGIARKGLGYFGHLVIRPLGLGIPMLPIMIVDELARPVTLAMRLFGNIFAGEVLLVVIGAIILANVVLPAHIILPISIPIIIAGGLAWFWLRRRASRRQSHGQAQTAMRLFGNISAGKVLLVVAGALIVANIVLPIHVIFPISIPVSKLAKAAPIGIYAFNMVIGAIQAVVFTLLTTAYLITPLSDEKH